LYNLPSYLDSSERPLVWSTVSQKYSPTISCILGNWLCLSTLSHDNWQIYNYSLLTNYLW
jgi:hypothetical protein